MSRWATVRRGSDDMRSGYAVDPPELLLKPGGFEGFRRVEIATDVNDPSISKRPGVGQRALKLDAGMSGLHLHSVDGEKLLPRADDPLQFDADALKRFEPLLRCPDD